MASWRSEPYVFFLCNFLFILNIFVSFLNLFVYFASGFWSLGSMLQFRIWKASFLIFWFCSGRCYKSCCRGCLLGGQERYFFYCHYCQSHCLVPEKHRGKWERGKALILESLMKNHSYYVSVSCLIWLKCSSFPVLVWWCWWCNRCWIRFFFFFWGDIYW